MEGRAGLETAEAQAILQGVLKGLQWLRLTHLEYSPSNREILL